MCSPAGQWPLPCRIPSALFSYQLPVRLVAVPIFSPRSCPWNAASWCCSAAPSHQCANERARSDKIIRGEAGGHDGHGRQGPLPGHAGRAVGETNRGARYYLAATEQGSRRAPGEAPSGERLGCRMPAGVQTRLAGRAAQKVGVDLASLVPAWFASRTQRLRAA